MTNQQTCSYIATIFLCLSTCLGSMAQNLDQSYLNTLKDEPLLSLFDMHYGDSTVQEKIARTYLDRARKQKDTIKMARGYDRLARIFHPEKNIAFADSVIVLTKDKSNVTYPSVGYIIKASNSQNEVVKIENLLLGFKFAKANDNSYLQLFILSLFFTLKNEWGNSEEAYLLLKENEKLLSQKNILFKLKKTFREVSQTDSIAKNEFETFKAYNDLDHIDSFLSLNLLDSIKNRFQSVEQYIINCKNCNKENITLYLDFQKIEFLYKKSRYDSVLLKLASVYKIHEKFVLRELLDYHFYYGNTLFKLGNIEEGLSHFRKIDNKVPTGYFYPDHRAIYDTLIKYSETENGINSKTYYLSRLVNLDTKLLETTRAIESSIIKYVEIPSLINKKDNLINQLKKENSEPNPHLYIVLSFLALSLSLLFYFARKRHLYKKRFETLLAQRNTKSVVSLYGSRVQNELSAAVVEDILEKLDRFERQHKYLDSEITLQNLAKKFKTNANYLSRVINLKLDKNFSLYLHDLRIVYAVEELLSNTSYRKYTIKAIAEECGYKSAESFSKAFYKVHGIYPSYYIKKLEKNTG
jgi:AraC-like DNA-binding protein